ncbi:hypothetical protein GGR58DRAFT_382510 [Xylaria digitata]|nr:hypothetical protein GGR58DRAFT_382510 [Xylaria digitata]
MQPNSSRPRSALTGRSKAGFNSASIPSKESNSSRNSSDYSIGNHFINLINAVIRKKAAVTTDLVNVEDTPLNSQSTEHIGENPDTLNNTTKPNTARLPTQPELIELSTKPEPVELSTGCEPVTAPRRPSQGVPSPPGGFGGVSPSWWSHTNGSDGRENGGITPRHRSNGQPALRPQLAQDGHFAPHMDYHDPYFHSAGPPAGLINNTQRSRGAQVIGIDVRSDYHGLYDARRETANFNAQGNSHKGIGTQVIGQRVQAGALPMQFSGMYTDNINFDGMIASDRNPAGMSARNWGLPPDDQFQSNKIQL